MAEIIVKAVSYSGLNRFLSAKSDEECADIQVDYLSAHVKKKEHPKIFKAIVELEKAIELEKDIDKS